MTVRVEGNRIVLEGRCPAEDADDLLSALHAQPDALVDGSAIRRAHTAVIQVLYALAPKIVAVPEEPSASANLLRRLISKGDIETETS
ncbi:hypothetical protein WBP06_19275 [Novosphingobium sp. BL-8H]|uniref:hypothetical protein n=1 Tax=Novosphingobium sp. BL-8H TaxID=3127640 RepID=UPI00375814C5